MASESSWNPLLLQEIRNLQGPLPLQVLRKHSADNSSFLRIDLDFSVFLPIPMNQGQVDRFSLRKILSNAPLAVVGNAFALGLRKRSEDGQHQLSILAQAIDILFLKVHRNPKRPQFPHRFKQRHRIARKSADRFCENAVDPFRPALFQQAPKLRTGILCSRIRFVRVYPRIFPSRMLLDVSAVMAHLCRKRMQHSVLSRGHTAVSCNALPAGSGCGDRLNLVNDPCPLLIVLFHGFRLLSRPYIPLFIEKVNGHFDTIRPIPERIALPALIARHRIRCRK